MTRAQAEAFLDAALEAVSPKQVTRVLLDENIDPVYRTHYPRWVIAHEMGFLIGGPVNQDGWKARTGFYKRH